MLRWSKNKKSSWNRSRTRSRICKRMSKYRM